MKVMSLRLIYRQKFQVLNFRKKSSRGRVYFYRGPPIEIFPKKNFLGGLHPLHPLGEPWSFVINVFYYVCCELIIEFKFIN